MGKPKIPPVWINLVGAILQIFGTVFLSRISSTGELDSSQYAFQFLAGLGCGFVNAALILLVPYAMEKKDLGKYNSHRCRNVQLTRKQLSEHLQYPNSVCSVA